MPASSLHPFIPTPMPTSSPHPFIPTPMPTSSPHPGSSEEQRSTQARSPMPAGDTDVTVAVRKGMEGEEEERAREGRDACGEGQSR